MTHSSARQKTLFAALRQRKPAISAFPSENFATSGIAPQQSEHWAAAAGIDYRLDAAIACLGGLVLGNLVALLGFAAVGALVLQPRLRRSDAWRATVTPLASIIGSGFLVSLPLLAREAGVHALTAMAGLIAFSYLLGGAVRFNIAYGEPLFADGKHRGLLHFAEVSRLVLAFAYFISVTYYLSLLAAFALKAAPIGNETVARLITTTLLAALGAGGFLRGLRGLESAEEIAVGLKLAVIGAVFAALALLNLDLLFHGAWRVDAPTPPFGLRQIRIVLGLLIIVQGFETSRFLQGAYPAHLRIRSMRWAQYIAGAIYLAFFALSFPILGLAPANLDVAGVTDMVAPAASILPVMLIGGAIFAQLSAAIADAIGGAGLIEETSGKRLPRKWAYLIIAGVGVALVWTLDVYQVIELASGAFAIFYALQALVAAYVAQRTAHVKFRQARAAGFILLAAAALAAALFGLPAEGG